MNLIYLSKVQKVKWNLIHLRHFIPFLIIIIEKDTNRDSSKTKLTTSKNFTLYENMIRK